MNINTYTLALLIYSQIKTNEKSNHKPSYFFPTYRCNLKMTDMAMIIIDYDAQ